MRGEYLPHGHAFVWRNHGLPCERAPIFLPNAFMKCQSQMRHSFLRFRGASCANVMLFNATHYSSRANDGRSGLEGRRHEAEAVTAGDADGGKRDAADPATGVRPRRATADRAASARGAPQESAGAGGAPHLRPHTGSALTECAGRGMPPPLAEPARGGGMAGDGLAPDGNLAIAERGEDAARRPPPRAGEVAAAFPAP